MATVPFTMRLEVGLKKTLEDEAKRMDRSASYLASSAIRLMLDARAAKREAVASALAEAEKGEFISSEAMHEWMASWDTDDELPPPEPDVFLKRG